MSHSKGKVIAAFAAVFVLGGVTGASAMHVIEARRTIDMFDAARQGTRHGVFVWSLERKLDLSPDQRQAVEGILARYDGEMAAVMAPVDPRAKELKKKMRADIRATLAPAQQARYDDLMAAWDLVRKRDKAEAAAPSVTLDR